MGVTEILLATTVLSGASAYQQQEQAEEAEEARKKQRKRREKMREKKEKKIEAQRRRDQRDRAEDQESLARRANAEGRSLLLSDDDDTSPNEGTTETLG